MQKGAKGDAVRHVQVLLASLGYDLGKGGTDGIFGSDTEEAVMQFQLEHGLKVDGIVGPQTLNALEVAATSPKGTQFVAQSSGASMNPTMLAAVRSGAFKTQGTALSTRPAFEVLGAEGTVRVLGARIPWPVVAVGGAGVVGLLAWALLRKRR